MYFSKKSVEAQNKKLNRRLRQLERYGLTKTKDYEMLVNNAIKEGATKSKKGVVRYKESLKKVDSKTVQKMGRISRRSNNYGNDTRKYKDYTDEIIRRFEKGGIKLSKRQIGDIVQAQKTTGGYGDLWGRLRTYYASKIAADIILDHRPEINVSNQLDIVEHVYSGKVPDLDVWLDWLKGYMTFDELKEAANKAIF